jgi:hypothetical protein
MASDRNMNRRQFLTGDSAAGALADLAARETSEPPPALADPAAQPYLVQLGQRAMACQFEAYLNAGRYPHATQTVLEGSTPRHKQCGSWHKAWSSTWARSANGTPPHDPSSMKKDDDKWTSETSSSAAQLAHSTSKCN